MPEFPVADVVPPLLITSMLLFLISYFLLGVYWLERRGLLKRMKAYAPTLKNDKDPQQVHMTVYLYRKSLS